MNDGLRPTKPLFYTFIICSLVILGLQNFSSISIDFYVLLGGNVIFYVTSLMIFFMQYRAMHHKNPNVFIRSVMLGMLIKMFVCLVAIIAYYFLSKSNFNKPAVYLSLLLYAIYLVVEVVTVMKLNKSKHA